MCNGPFEFGTAVRGLARVFLGTTEPEELEMPPRHIVRGGGKFALGVRCLPPLELEDKYRASRSIGRKTVSLCL